jgi:hypothetical protein
MSRASHRSIRTVARALRFGGRYRARRRPDVRLRQPPSARNDAPERRRARRREPPISAFRGPDPTFGIGLGGCQRRSIPAYIRVRRGRGDRVRSTRMPARLSRSRLLLDVSSVYHCQPTVSWWPESGQVIVVVTHTTPRPVDHTNAFAWRVTAAAVVPNSPTKRPKDAAESRRVGTAFGSAGAGATTVITTHSSGHPAPTAHAHDRGSGRGWRRSRGTARSRRVSSLVRRPSMSTSLLGGTPPFSR